MIHFTVTGRPPRNIRTSRTSANSPRNWEGALELSHCSFVVPSPRTVEVRDEAKVEDRGEVGPGPPEVVPIEDATPKPVPQGNKVKE